MQIFQSPRDLTPAVRAVPAVLGRARRRAGLDRNPVRRPEDRLQTGVGILLILTFFTVAPLAALLSDGIAAATVTITALLVGFVGGFIHVVHRLDRIRDRLWDRAWAQADLLWNDRD